jgi:hypothetical protein
MKPSRKNERAKYLTSSKPTPAPTNSFGYSYCESVHATSTSPWHIRRLDEQGQKLGGGITTRSLCGLVKQGWDLQPSLQPSHNQHTCIECLAEYLRQTGV